MDGNFDFLIDDIAKETGDKSLQKYKSQYYKPKNPFETPARKLGVDPVDLATLISYETGGSFDPHIVGGKNNGYKGLIQFGESERKLYYKEGQSFDEQLNDGVVRYFQDRFGQVGRKTQGATLLDLYKTVNGGNPNVSENASDGVTMVNGQPVRNTIKSHVERMLKEHRPKVLKRFFNNQDDSQDFSFLVDDINKTLPEPNFDFLTEQQPKFDKQGVLVNQLGGEEVQSGDVAGTVDDLARNNAPFVQVQPERGVTLQAQSKAMLDRNNNSAIGVLYTDGERIPDPARTFIEELPTPEGVLHVSIPKLKKWFENQNPNSEFNKYEVLADIQNGKIKVSDIIGGKVKEFSNTTDQNTIGGTAVVATDKNGNELNATKISDNSPENLTPQEQSLIQKQKELDKNRFGEAAANTGITSSEEIVNSRREDRPIETLGEFQGNYKFPEPPQTTPQTVSDLTNNELKKKPPIDLEFQNYLKFTNKPNNDQTRAEYERLLAANSAFGKNIEVNAALNTPTATETKEVDAAIALPNESSQTQTVKANDIRGLWETQAGKAVVDLSKFNGEGDINEWAFRQALKTLGLNSEQINRVIDRKKTKGQPMLSGEGLKPEDGQVQIGMNFGNLIVGLGGDENNIPPDVQARFNDLQTDRNLRLYTSPESIGKDALGENITASDYVNEQNRRITRKSDEDYQLRQTAINNLMQSPFSDTTEEGISDEIEFLKKTKVDERDLEESRQFGQSLNKTRAGQLFGGLMGSVGSFGDFFSGMFRPLRSVGIDYPSATWAQVSQGAKLINAEANKNADTIGEVLNVTGALPLDLTRLAVLARLPSGAVAGFAVDSALQSAGRNESLLEVARQGIKGGTLGALFPVSSKVGNLTKEFTPLLEPIAKIGTVTAGTYTVERAFGAPHDQALKSAILNGVFETIQTYGTKGLDKIYRVWQKGTPTDVRVDKEGNVSVTRGQLPDNVIDIELVLDPNDGIYKRRDEIGQKVENAASVKKEAIGQIEGQTGVRRLEEKNPLRYEKQDAKAAQEASESPKAQKILELLKKNEALTVEEIAKTTRLKNESISQIIDLLYRSRMVEILPDNRVRKIEGSFLPEKQTANLYDTYLEQQKNEPIKLKESSLTPQEQNKTVQPEISEFEKNQTEIENRTATNYENLPEKKVQAETEDKPKAQVIYAEPEKTSAKLNRIYTERGTQADIQPKVIDESELLTSLDEGYPPELQPRDRSRQASKAQISEIANKLNPEFLGDSPKASDGRPLVVAVQVNGQKKYAVVSGNGRSEAIRAVYKNNSDKSAQYAQFAQSKDENNKKENPVYVGVLNPNQISNLSDFAKEANESTTAQMSRTEQAKADAEGLSSDTLNLFIPSDDGSIHGAANKDFIRAFIENVSPTERGALQTSDGALSQEGIIRIKNAIFAKAFGESERGLNAIQRVAESTDNNIKNITNGLLMKAGHLASLKQAIADGKRYAEFDITNDIAAAVEKFASLREKNTPLEEYIQQGNLFGAETTPFQTRVMQIFERYKRSGKAIRGILNNFIDLAEAAGNPNQQNLFGKTPEIDIRSAFEAAVKYYEDTQQKNDEQQELFDGGDKGLQTEFGSNSKVSKHSQNEKQTETAKSDEIISATDAAHDAATSPQNDLPEPSDAQREAGNYKMGHINVNGLDITVEIPKGGARKGVNKKGVAWERILDHHYGYIKRSVGADKENIDVFVNDGTPQDFSGDVYVIDQYHPNGEFDEHKVMIGYASEEEARTAYLSNYPKDWKGLGKINAMSFEDFKKWTSEEQSKPVSENAVKKTGLAAIINARKKTDNSDEILQEKQSNFVSDSIDAFIPYTITELAKVAEFNINKSNGLIKLNPAGGMLLRWAIQYVTGREEGFIGVYFNPIHAGMVKSAIEYFANAVTEKDAASNLKNILETINDGDLTFIVTTPETPLSEKFAAQEELLHRADFRSRKYKKLEIDKYLNLDGYRKAVENIKKVYTTSSERGLHNEVIAKMLRDDAEKHLGINKQELAEIKEIYLNSLLSLGTTVNEIENNFKDINEIAKEFIENAKRKSEKILVENEPENVRNRQDRRNSQQQPRPNAERSFEKNRNSFAESRPRNDDRPFKEQQNDRRNQDLAIANPKEVIELSKDLPEFSIQFNKATKAEVSYFKKFVNNFVKNERESSRKEILTNFRRAGLLTSPKTHLRNMSSNALMQASEESIRPLALLADLAASAVTKKRTIQAPSVPSVFKSFAALVRADETFKTLHLESGISRAWNILKNGDISEMKKNQLNEMRSGFPLLDKFVNTTFRFLGAEDALFKVYATRRSLEEQAKTLAITESREKISKFNSFLDRQKFIQNRKNELLANPTKAMLLEAMLYADFTTFTNDNPVSDIVKQIKDVNENVKFAVETVIPYDKTPTNIILRSLEHTPLGFVWAGKHVYDLKKGSSYTFDKLREKYLREYEDLDGNRIAARIKLDNKIKEYISNLDDEINNAPDRDDLRAERDRLKSLQSKLKAKRKIKDAFRETDREEISKAIDEIFPRIQQQMFARSFGRAGLGTSALALGIYLAMLGLLSGSYNAGEKDESKEFFNRRDKGILNGSLKIGNRRFQINDTPLGKVMVIGASLWERSQKPLQKDQTKTSQTFENIGDVGGDLIFEQPLLNTLSDYFGSNKTLEKRIGGLLGSFVPAIVADVADVSDNEARRNEKLLDAAQNRIPVLRSYNEPAKKPREPYLQNPTNRIVNKFDPFNSRPLEGEISLAISMKMFEGKKQSNKLPEARLKKLAEQGLKQAEKSFEEGQISKASLDQARKVFQ